MQQHNVISKSVQVDPLTKLLDYVPFIDLLNQRFSSDSDSKKTLTALLFIEFDDLAQFNDIFGFNTDDQLIIQLSEKLSLLLKSEDVLARAGDNQYIIMQDLSASENPKELAKHIMHMLSEPFVVDTNIFYINASIGISCYPMDGNDAYRLIKTAKNTMRHAQKDGKNNIAFTPHRVALSSYEKSVRIMEDLPAAIENGEIYFAYQPQYSYTEERFIGAEMLARWRHPEYGEVSPEFFIPLAEKSGMVGPLTVKALVDASKAFTLFESEGIDDFSLSVNISPVFLMRSTFYKTIEFLMEQYPLSGKNINFEITEEVLMKNTDNLIKTLEKLKALDIGIELDDFGTGYTSLQHLAYLPIDTLKVDKSFVSGIDKNAKKKALFKAIVDMSHALNIDVIVEGVENSSEDRIIKTFKPTKAQGYFYSRPIHRDVLVEKLKQHNKQD
ncbi:MAG: GGDEF domain-containing protein [Sulfurovum sp.]|nr:MAG: GGDEF domain-containing protein [Sulfurovum sp.]